MLVLPPLTAFFGMSKLAAGAARAGSVDATGNVIAAAAMLDDEDAEEMAALVKMAHNMFLPVIVIIISAMKEQVFAWHAKLNGLEAPTEKDASGTAQNDSVLGKI